MSSNFISLGDHCYSALLLKELGLRTSAYPFDWIAHTDELNGNLSNLIVDILSDILDGGSIDCILASFMPAPPDAESSKMYAVHNHVKFPHDRLHESQDLYEQDVAKYRRRFWRLAKRIHAYKPVHYLLISKRYDPNMRHIHFFQDCLAWHPDSRVTIVTGTKRIHTERMAKVTILSAPYRSNIPDWVEYTGNDYSRHDLLYWRDQVKRLVVAEFNGSALIQV
jgi:hypothetical protein